MPTQLAPTVPLIDGSAMPAIGFAASASAGAAAATAVRTAIETGYRLIDTAENYHNEDAVGRGIRDSGIDRAELFITSKFNRHWHSVAVAQRAHEASLDRLGVAAGRRHVQLQASPSAAGTRRDRHRAGCQPDTAQPVHDPRVQPRIPRRAPDRDRVVESNRRQQ